MKKAFKTKNNKLSPDISIQSLGRLLYVIRMQMHSAPGNAKTLAFDLDPFSTPACSSRNSLKRSMRGSCSRYFLYRNLVPFHSSALITRAPAALMPIWMPISDTGAIGNS